MILALIGLFIISSVDLKAQVVTGYATDPEDEFFRAGRSDVSIGDVAIFRSAGQSGERNSSLMLSKRYEGQSLTKDGTFSVENSITQIRLSIHGKVRSGSITVTLNLPDGKEFKKLIMDDSADISWMESIKIKDGETKYHGDWKYTIATNKADGEYNFSIKTN